MLLGQFFSSSVKHQIKPQRYVCLLYIDSHKALFSMVFSTKSNL